jgi:hypothetical protein
VNGTSWNDPATGMQWNGAKFYDPGAGRFVNEDPEGLAAANYIYQTNNPSNVIFTTPSNGDLLTRATNFFAGAADFLTLGGTKAIRDVTGNDVVDTDSPQYKAGQGAAQSLVIAAATAGAGAFFEAGLLGSAVLGAGLSTANYVGQAAISGQQITLGGLAGAAVGGALGGLGAAAFGTSWVGLIAGGAVTGATASASNSIIQQLVDRGSVNWGAVSQAGIDGAVGGALAGAAFKTIGGSTGLLSEASMQCNLGATDIAMYTLASAAAGAVGGGLGNIATQLLQTDGSAVDWNQVLDASVNGAVGGAVGYLAARSYFAACYRKGTRLKWKKGQTKPIEEFKSYEEYGDDCDWILTRDENDPSGPLVMRRVLRKFVRVSEILNLHIGGRTIGTTGEHPHWVVNKAGFVPAAFLEPGDVVLSDDGQLLPVERVEHTGQVETVYNLEVEGTHTYFVTGEGWGFSVWAHNANYATAEEIAESNGNVRVREDLPGGTGSMFDEANGTGVYVLRNSKGQIEYVGSGDAPARLEAHATPGSGKEDLTGQILFNNNLSAAEAISLEQELQQLLGGVKSTNSQTSLRNQIQALGEGNPQFTHLEFAASDSLVIEALQRAGVIGR